MRLPVDPAPFMVFKGEQLNAVYQMLFDAIERIRSAGMKVIVDLHPNSRHPVWGQNAVIAGLEAPTFTAFSNAVEDVARHLSRFPASDVALELINEPRLKCKGADQTLWQQMLKALIERARAGNSEITLIVTGACISTPDGLLAPDPTMLGDRSFIYTFHYYEPFTFTHQGAQFIPWPDKYLDGVPWPAKGRPIEQPLADLARNVQTMNLDEPARQTALAGASNNLEKFYASNAGPDLIEKRFAAVAAWATQHQIPPNRIFIGEFGVLRHQGNAPGARCADRARWLADVRSAADRYGFSWSYFNYDVLLRCSSTTKIGNSILLYSRAWAWRTKRKGPVKTGKNEVWTTSSSLALRRIGKGRDDAPTMPIKKSIAGSLLPGALDTMATRLGKQQVFSDRHLALRPP